MCGRVNFIFPNYNNLPGGRDTELADDAEDSDGNWRVYKDNTES